MSRMLSGRPVRDDPGMWRTGIVLAVIAGSLLASARPAAACSAGPFQPRDLTLDVVRVYRGVAGPRVTFVDPTSIAVDDGIVSFAGGSGMCGTVDRDPVGQHVLIALALGDDGRWYANRLFGAVYTDGPDYVLYLWLLQRHGVPVPFLVTGLVTETLAEPAPTP